MPQTPHRIMPDTPDVDKWGLVNDNFDKAVQDMSDLGAKFTGSGSASVTIAAGSFFYYIISMRDTAGGYVKDRFPITLRYDLAIDVNDSDHYIPDGTALTATQRRTLTTTRILKNSRNYFTDEKATATVGIYNDDTVDHTYYFLFDIYYQQAANQGGIFR